jgi:hypothetical protein
VRTTFSIFWAVKSPLLKPAVLLAVNLHNLVDLCSGIFSLSAGGSFFARLSARWTNSSADQILSWKTFMHNIVYTWTACPIGELIHKIHSSHHEFFQV